MNNTIIVVWEDHGYHFGYHQLWNKHSILSRLLAHHLSSITLKQNRSEIVTPTEFVDVFPTLIDIAELKPLDYLDGTLFHL